MWFSSFIIMMNSVDSLWSIELQPHHINDGAVILVAIRFYIEKLPVPCSLVFFKNPDLSFSLTGCQPNLKCSVLSVRQHISVSYLFKKWNMIENNHHHHHHVVPQALISLTLSRHFSLSFIASGRSSGLHLVSSHSCCMYVRAGHPAFAGHMWGSIGVHHLWARPRFSSSVLHVLFIWLG